MKIIEDDKSKNLGKFEPGTILRVIDGASSIHYLLVAHNDDGLQLINLKDGAQSDPEVVDSFDDYFTAYEQVTVHHTMKLVLDNE